MNSSLVWGPAVWRSHPAKEAHQRARGAARFLPVPLWPLCPNGCVRPHLGLLPTPAQALFQPFGGLLWRIAAAGHASRCTYAVLVGTQLCLTPVRLAKAVWVPPLPLSTMQDLCQGLHYAGHVAGAGLLDLLKLAKSVVSALQVKESSTWGFHFFSLGQDNSPGVPAGVWVVAAVQDFTRACWLLFLMLAGWAEEFEKRINSSVGN